MKEMKTGDFLEMIKTSADIGYNDEKETYETPNDVEITIQDEDGNIYSVLNVRFNREAGVITIEFDHDE